MLQRRESDKGGSKMRSTIGLAMAALLAVSECALSIEADDATIEGSGVMKEETRKLPAFRSVDISASFEAAVAIGEKASVVLDGDDNLLPLIKAEVSDDVLRVSLAEGRGVRSRKPLKVTIVVPRLESIAARGASKVVATVGEAKSLRVETEGAASARVDGLDADSIRVKAEGASQVTLTGRAKGLTLDVSGASQLFAGDATFESARIRLDGASRGELRVTGSIDGEISGASSLKVGGKPKDRGVKTSGASTVTY